MMRSVATLALLLPAMASAADLSGPARAIDGDTLEVAGQRIRLPGIDAPERHQTCEGRDGQTYECGRDAAATLAALIRDRTVTCKPQDRDRYGRIVAVCSTEAGDIGAVMVRAGQAIAYQKYSDRYAPEEAAAKREGLGMWSGRFMPPWEWRKERGR